MFVNIGNSSVAGRKKKAKQVIDPSSVAAPEEWLPSAPVDFADRPAVAIDLETNDPHLKERGPGVRTGAFICGVALRVDGLSATYHPIAHKRGPNMDDPAAFMRWLKKQAMEFKGELRGSNLSYDLDFLQHQGITFPQAKIFDTQIAEPLIDENQFRFGLGALGEKYFETGKLGNLEELYGAKCMSHVADMHSFHVAEYAARDVDLSWRVADVQRQLLADDNLTALFANIECPLIPLLVRMRAVGVRVNVSEARGVKRDLVTGYQQAQRDLDDLVGEKVSVWSNISMGNAFDRLGLSYPMTEAADPVPSFRVKWLEAHPHAVAKLVLAVRHGQKLAGTFVENVVLGGNINGRIHCTFNQLKADDSGTVTGRFSSSNPNLQQIPVRTEAGALIRSLFIPEEDHDWGSADYSQIEPRLLAHYAFLTRIGGVPLPGATEMVTRYREDEKADFHAMSADITGADRKVAKGILLGTIYGAGPAKISEMLGLEFNEAVKILTEFNTRLPFLKKLSEFCSRRARAKGQIVTLLGRKRRLRERQFRALNCLCQGSAADIMKKAMVDCERSGVFGVLVPHLTVHDELDVSVPRTAAGKEAFAEMCRLMENTVKLEVPLYVDGKVGANWRDAHA